MSESPKFWNFLETNCLCQHITSLATLTSLTIYLFHHVAICVSNKVVYRVKERLQIEVVLHISLCSNLCFSWANMMEFLSGEISYKT